MALKTLIDRMSKKEYDTMMGKLKKGDTSGSFNPNKYKKQLKTKIKLVPRLNKFLAKKGKYKEGDKRFNKTAKRWERLTPSGTWKLFGPSNRTRIAKATARIAKGTADQANKKSSIAKATIKGLPAAAKKVYGAMTGAGSRKKMEEKRDLLKKKESLLKKNTSLQKQIFKRMMNK